MLLLFYSGMMGWLKILLWEFLIYIFFLSIIVSSATKLTL
jgi:hypothetical protein